MKKIIQFIVTLAGIALLVSCAKEETIKASDSTVGGSRIIFFPLLATNGSRLVIIKQGDAYTDAGATASLNGKTNPFITAGTVDPAKPGIYVLNYDTKNTDGFSATDYRTVVVIGNDVTANNFSGTYARYVAGAANGQTSTWTKTANGVYTVLNPGGATGVSVTAVNYSGNIIAIPFQSTSVGPFSSTGGLYNPASMPPSYAWAIVNSGYGTAARQFIKQ